MEELRRLQELSLVSKITTGGRAGEGRKLLLPTMPTTPRPPEPSSPPPRTLTLGSAVHACTRPTSKRSKMATSSVNSNDRTPPKRTLTCGGGVRVGQGGPDGGGRGRGGDRG